MFIRGTGVCSLNLSLKNFNEFVFSKRYQENKRHSGVIDDCVVCFRRDQIIQEHCSDQGVT